MKLLRYLIAFSILLAFSPDSFADPAEVDGRPAADKTRIVGQTDSVVILLEEVKPPVDEFDVAVSALWLKDRKSGELTKLFQTVKPEEFYWYKADDKTLWDAPIDSITAVSDVYIINESPLQLVVEGVPDCRNVFSYLIDVPTRQAWNIPSNGGFAGLSNEESYMIFQSYRYRKGGGRYTLLQIFDPFSRKFLKAFSLEKL